MMGKDWVTAKILILILFLVVLPGCSRKLTSNESAFLGQIHKHHLNYDKIRIHNGIAGGVSEVEKNDRLLSDLMMDEKMVSVDDLKQVAWSRPEALVLFNDIYYSKEIYKDDLLEGYPGLVDLDAVSLLAHEVTHVWQHQNRELTGYSLGKVISEHIRYKDPYKYDIEPGKKFTDYRFEQQGAMVQRYVFLKFVNSDDPEFLLLDEIISPEFPTQQLIKNLKEVCANYGKREGRCSPEYENGLN